MDCQTIILVCNWRLLEKQWVFDIMQMNTKLYNDKYHCNMSKPPLKMSERLLRNPILQQLAALIAR